MMCDACVRGDHANCGMQSWCLCDNELDGNHEAVDFDPTRWCNGCGARRQQDCDCGPIAENN